MWNIGWTIYTTSTLAVDILTYLRKARVLESEPTHIQNTHLELSGYGWNGSDSGVRGDLRGRVPSPAACWACWWDWRPLQTSHEKLSEMGWSERRWACVKDGMWWWGGWVAMRWETDWMDLIKLDDLKPSQEVVQDLKLMRTYFHLMIRK